MNLSLKEILFVGDYFSYREAQGRLLNLIPTILAVAILHLSTVDLFSSKELLFYPEMGIAIYFLQNNNHQGLR